MAETALLHKKPLERIHGIDALRGVAMILGILLHATIAYKTVPLRSWPHDGMFHHWIFDYLYLLIHSFRMPLFFLIAGFFCRFLYLKIGLTAFLNHRAKRILYPFILSLFFILPLTIYPFLAYRQSQAYPGQWTKILLEAYHSLFQWNGMAHLWFLYYLLIYYTATVLVLKAGEVTTQKAVVSTILKKTGALKLGSYLGLFTAVVLTAGILLLEPGLYLHVDTGFFPSASYVLFFAFFFYWGWQVHKDSSSFFTWVTQKSRLFLSTGLALSVITFYWDVFSWPTSLYALAGIKFVAALQTVLLAFGSIGFFLRNCKTESTMWKYISDASYWMYLTHLFMIAGLETFFLFVDMPGVLKFSLVLTVPIAISLLTYHYWVRYSKVGTLLHGQRQKKPLVDPDRKVDLFLRNPIQKFANK